MGIDMLLQAIDTLLAVVAKISGTDVKTGNREIACQGVTKTWHAKECSRNSITVVVALTDLIVRLAIVRRECQSKEWHRRLIYDVHPTVPANGIVGMCHNAKVYHCPHLGRIVAVAGIVQEATKKFQCRATLQYQPVFEKVLAMKYAILEMVCATYGGAIS